MRDFLSGFFAIKKAVKMKSFYRKQSRILRCLKKDFDEKTVDKKEGVQDVQSWNFYIQKKENLCKKKVESYPHIEKP